MKYYLFEPTHECMGGGPYTDQFEGFSVKGPHAWQSEHLAVKVPYLYEQPDIEDAGELADVIDFGGGIRFAASLSVKTLIETMRIGDDLMKIPASVFNRAGIHLAEYYYVCSQVRHAVVDRDRAKLRTDEQSGIIMDVFKWAIKDSQLPPFDFFYTEAFQWIATEILKDLFELHDISGCKFTEIWETGR